MQVGGEEKSGDAAWMRLCELIDDDVEIVDSVRMAVTDPAAYFQEHERELLDRGIEDAADVDPWLALIDGLDEAGALAYLDWKDSGAELADALARVPRVVRAGIELDDVSDIDELEAAAAGTDALLSPHGLRLVYLDEDSDAYPLVVVPTQNAGEIIELAARLEREARIFS